VAEPASISMQEASDADLPAVLDLYAQPEFDAGRVLEIEQARRILSRFAAYPDYTLYVAKHDEAVVGSFALLIMDNLGHLGAPSAIVEDVVVSPEFHRKGVGRAMMDFAGAVSRRKGCYKLVLSSNARRAGAHAFYASLGFEPHGVSFSLRLASDCHDRER
jgi:GNAT superfamily N-acetyltransferase